MSQLDMSAETFQIKFEQFLIGCEEIEQGDIWNLEEYGEMQDYYAGLIVSMILRIVTSEGWISDEDIEYLNLLFGFSYDGGELEQVFEGCRDMVTSPEFETDLKKSALLLRQISTERYHEFHELVGLIGEIFANSEGFISESQKNEMLHLQELLP